MIRFARWWLLGGLAFLTATPLVAQNKGGIPTAAEVQALLQKEPISDASWPAWRTRLNDWFGDLGHGTDDAYRAAERYIGGKADSLGQLPARFDQDHLAWYFLGGSFLHKQPVAPEDMPRAEQAYRRCISIEPAFARGHRNLAQALLSQVKPGPGDGMPINPRLDEADRELKEALRLEPGLPLSGIDGFVAQRRGNFKRAIAIFEKELRKDPQVGYALAIADCVLMDSSISNPTVHILPLVDQFPNDGVLAVLYAISLAKENRLRESYDELQRARSLGTDPRRSSRRSSSSRSRRRANRG